tara:strand:- start:1100 stop:1618 length:519 start_codon:yes stop_codon:yes gene_type:complete
MEELEKNNESFGEKLAKSLLTIAGRVVVVLFIIVLLIMGFQFYFLLFNNRLTRQQKNKVYLFAILIAVGLIWFNQGYLEWLMIFLGYLFMKLLHHLYYKWNIHEYIIQDEVIQNEDDESWPYAFFFSVFTVLLFISSLILWTYVESDLVLYPVSALIVANIMGVAASLVKDD